MHRLVMSPRDCSFSVKGTHHLESAHATVGEGEDGHFFGRTLRHHLAPHGQQVVHRVLAALLKRKTKSS